MSQDKKVILKLKRNHPSAYRLGRHEIRSKTPLEFSLNKDEQKELKGKGAQHWLEVVSQKQMDAMPKSNQENKEMVRLRGIVSEVFELTGEETIEDLKAMELQMKEEAEEKEMLIQELADKIELTGKETVEDLRELVKK